MKYTLIPLIFLFIVSCKGEDRATAGENTKSENDSIFKSEITLEKMAGEVNIELDLEEANELVKLPLSCIETEYPNKLGQTLGGEQDIRSPQDLHPAFYGCFDWHSAVHGQWSLVKLIKQFPKLDRAQEIQDKLQAALSKENIAAEIKYFQGEHNRDYERTYGWAWLLKLSEELHTWDSELGRELSANIQPLADLIVIRFTEFLPKLYYPVRVGEHSNTAFALSFAHDYAVTTENKDFGALIDKRAKEFYLTDDDCPVIWEPSGFDFLSPCLQEVDIMRKILPKAAFNLWMEDFMPELKNTDFTMAVGEVTDRKDGKLVHLDGLNFSRAWVFYGLANQYPEDYAHLNDLANKHVSYSFPNLVGDSYEGGHWLGSFALYALQERKPQN